MLANFLIIGAQKAGTTSLLTYLSRHPSVFVPEEKELGYFHDSRFYARGIEYYKKFFSGWQGEAWVGHAPVNVLFYAKASAPRIYDFNPNMKLIVIFRNPVDRAYSAYWYFRRNGLETASSFDEAIRRELPRIHEIGPEGKNCFYYIAHGFYYDQIEVFLNIFKEDQILMLLYDDLKSNPQVVMRKVYDFLSIHDPGHLEPYQKHNAAAMPKFASIHKYVYNESILKRLYKRILPEEVRYHVRRGLIRPVLRRNLKPFQYPPMTPATRELLQDIYREPNSKLARILGRSLKSWG